MCKPDVPQLNEKIFHSNNEKKKDATPTPTMQLKRSENDKSNELMQEALEFCLIIFGILGSLLVVILIVTFIVSKCSSKCRL